MFFFKFLAGKPRYDVRMLLATECRCVYYQYLACSVVASELNVPLWSVF